VVGQPQPISVTYGVPQEASVNIGAGAATAYCGAAYCGTVYCCGMAYTGAAAGGHVGAAHRGAAGGGQAGAAAYVGAGAHGLDVGQQHSPRRHGQQLQPADAAVTIATASKVSERFIFSVSSVQQRGDYCLGSFRRMSD